MKFLVLRYIVSTHYTQKLATATTHNCECSALIAVFTFTL